MSPFSEDNGGEDTLLFQKGKETLQVSLLTSSSCVMGNRQGHSRDLKQATLRLTDGSQPRDAM